MPDMDDARQQMPLTSHDVERVFRCPICHGSLSVDFSTCPHCGTVSRRAGRIWDFLGEEDHRDLQRDLESDRENAFKNFFKRWPRLYDRLARIVSPVLFTGLTAEAFARGLPDDGIYLNAGSGPTRLHPRMIGVDVYPFPSVDVLSKAERLPFADHAFDATICDTVLEHVADPIGAARELQRVTKTGGLIYLCVPFIFPLHPSPKDYSRWSVDGAARLVPECDVIGSGVAMGPTSGMLTVLTSWLAILCSFGISPLRKVLHYVFMIVLNPLKLLDLILARMPGAEMIAATVYIVARKR